MQNKIIKLKSVDSSNNYASLLLKKSSVEEGTVIWAEEQTNGRGQEGNHWESEKEKNLTFSLILFPDFLKIEELFYLSKAISLGLVDFLSQYLNNVSIKWPNDIYTGNSKIAGILIENIIESDHIKNSIVGIGLNVNQETFTSALNPISMKLITKKEFILLPCLMELLKFINLRYKLLQCHRFKPIDDEYIKWLYKLNKNAHFVCNNEFFTAKIIGVEKNGELILEINENTVKKFSFKEVEYLS